MDEQCECCGYLEYECRCDAENDLDYECEKCGYVPTNYELSQGSCPECFRWEQDQKVLTSPATEDPQ